ncbi:outer membrane lipoprotein chaperone LolA [Aliiglaciecola sp.]|nr:outer membrane lipoprotein chaperone LolA [Aliiglaciecola sp.]
MKVSRKLWAIIIPSILFFNVVKAQNLESGADASAAIASNEDSASDDAAVSLKALLKGLKTFKAQFKQTVNDAQGELLQESGGELSLKQPNLMLWQVIEPDENQMIADGQTLWYVDPFVEQVTAVQQAQSVANNPVVLLTDPDNTSWQDFSIHLLNDEYVIEALNPESQIARLILQFDKQGVLSSLRFIDRQQQISALQFSNIEQNQTITDDVFVFALPEGFEMDDQR